MKDRSEWWGVCERECMGCSPDLDEVHSCGMPQLYEAFEGWKSVCDRAYNLKEHKGEILCFSSFLSFVSLLLSLISWHDACQSCGG